MRIAVVLPAPLGPTNPTMVPSGTRERHAVERHEVAERTAQGGQLEHGNTVGGDTRLSLGTRAANVGDRERQPGFETSTTAPTQSSWSRASSSAVAKSPRVIDAPGAPLVERGLVAPARLVVGEHRGGDHGPVEVADPERRERVAMLLGHARELALERSCVEDA